MIMLITNNFAANIDSIYDKISYSTVQIRTKFISRPDVVGTGTGFFFVFDLPGKGKIPCLITNKHVTRKHVMPNPIENSIEGEITFHLKNGEGKPEGALPCNITNSSWQWVDHPNNDIDLCALPLIPIIEELRTTKGLDIFFYFLDKSNVINPQELDKLSPVSDILMVGYPNGLIDRVNNFPIFRTGITASHPGRNFNGKAEFLIDSACWQGSSGSPVFIKGPSITIRGKGLHIASELEHKFLGVLWGGQERTAQGIVSTEIPIALIPNVQAAVNIPINLGFVVHAKEILAIEEELKKIR